MLDLDVLTKHDRLILMTPTERPARLAWLRKLLPNTRPPVVGHLHAADPAWLMPCIAEMLLSGFGRNDAFVCSSRAGRKCVERLIGATRQALSVSEHEDAAPFQTPITPLGIDCSSFDTVKALRDATRQSLRLP